MEQVRVTLLGALGILACMGVAQAQAQPTPGSAVATPAAGSTVGAKISEKEKDSPSFTIENSLTIRDPFRRPAPPGSANDLTIPELERFELEKYKLVGVMTGPKKPKALIVAPSGKMHIIDASTRIGTRHGVVRQIMQGAISVEEKVVNLLGQEENIETLIEMKDESAKKE